MQVIVLDSNLVRMMDVTMLLVNDNRREIKMFVLCCKIMIYL